METIDALEVHLCLQRCVPHIADHLSGKAARNDGFWDNPKCIHPVTKLVTLSLDTATRACVENELCEAAVARGASFQDAKRSLQFALACMQTLTERRVYEAFVDLENGLKRAESLWLELDVACGRDGLLYLQHVRTQNLDRDAYERLLDFLLISNKN